MIINELSLTNFRGFENARFTFRPGINLIAGVNGAGKSTALDAIRILISRASREILKSQEPTVDVGPADIRKGSDFTFLSVEFGMPNGPARTVYQYEGKINIQDFEPGKKVGDVRDEGTIRRSGFRFYTPVPLFLAPGGSPLCVFFSPHRSLLEQSLTGSKSKYLAFINALSERRFNLRQAAEWLVAMETLAKEHYGLSRRVEAIETAIRQFMDEPIGSIQALPAVKDNLNPGKVITQAKLVVSKNGHEFDLSKLSDGERGILALVIEIARRLALAYPDLDDPIVEGSACILIDEIELHLHPKWQRDVLKWLTSTFPSCQFIVTTHSPQVIGEIEADRIWYLASSSPPWQQERSLGLDSSRVISELMGGRARNAETDALLDNIAHQIHSKEYSLAKKSLKALCVKLGENDPDVIRSQGLIDFLEAPIDPD